MQYLTPAQVAERLSVRTPTVRDWIRTGKLEAYKFGRLIRIREDAIDEMAELVTVHGIENVPTIKRRQTKAQKERTRRGLAKHGIFI